MLQVGLLIAIGINSEICIAICRNGGLHCIGEEDEGEEKNNQHHKVAAWFGILQMKVPGTSMSCRMQLNLQSELFHLIINLICTKK